MAEFALPANSRMTKGQSHSAPASAKNVKTFQIYRWSPDDDANPRIDSFNIDLDDCGPMVLDLSLITHLRDNETKANRVLQIGD